MTSATKELVPWGTAKLGFDAPKECVSDDIFNADVSTLPDGWELTETYFTPIAAIAIFEVEGMPTISDGNAVKLWLSKIQPEDQSK